MGSIRGWCLLVGALVSVSGVAQSCASQEELRFRCGTRSIQGQVVRYCNRGNEVCVCSTGYCAIRDALCETGLVYVDPPFGPTTHPTQGRCVARTDIVTSFAQTDMMRECPVPADTAQTDASAGANSSDVQAQEGGDR